MKNTLLLLFIVAFASCKQASEKENTTPMPAEEVEAPKQVMEKSYPEQISKVFEAHGGLETWNAMHTLAFTMEKPNGAELTTTDLKSRKAHIDMPNHVLGFDGKAVWLQAKDTTAYKGKPKLYYNLMFYFYAMPFVLSDDGITYTDVAPLVYEGVEYPGIQISYGAGVGESPEDEYILYYNPETYQMAWLAYTMTYFTKEKSKKFNYIKYANWQDVNGVKLPKSIQWFNVVEGKPVDMRNEVVFSDVSLSKAKQEASFYETPESAEVVE
jgi:hypothetical protein